VSLVLAFAMCPLGAARATEEALTREVGGLTFDQFVQAALRDYGVPGATVVIANANETVFLKGMASAVVMQRGRWTRTHDFSSRR
jgi:hypothetical protein